MKDGSNMTEKLLDLTLEIIYLLTGEIFPPVKPGGGVTILVPSRNSLIPKRNNKQKILEVTNKIIELLMEEEEEAEHLEGQNDQEDVGHLAQKDQEGKMMLEDEEIPLPDHQERHPTDGGIILTPQIKEEDVTRDEEYAGGHKELYKEAMMADQPPDGSSHSIPTGEWTSLLLYSQPCTQGDALILPQYQGEELLNVKIEEEEQTCVTADQQTTGEGNMMGTGEQHGQNRLEIVSVYSECGKSSTSESISITHGGGTQQPSAAQPFLCTDCGKTFSQYEYLLTHQKIHTGEHQFSCSVCGKGFIEKRELLQHQQTHIGASHPGVHFFSCPYCGKAFNQYGSFLRHQSIHTGVRPFSCSECGKSFNQSGSLTRHQKIHSGERPYSCSECGKGFIEKRNLIQHQNTHTGERPFSCSGCGRAYSGKRARDQHQKIHNCGVKKKQGDISIAMNYVIATIIE